MKKLYLLCFVLCFAFSQVGAQDPTPGTFIGQPERVECGTTAFPTAKVNYKLMADNYHDARITAESVRWRFENLYANAPSYLREYYVCKSKVCETEPACWANAEVISVDAVRLTPIDKGVYLLRLHVNYKVQCLECN